MVEYRLVGSVQEGANKKPTMGRRKTALGCNEVNHCPCLTIIASPDKRLNDVVVRYLMKCWMRKMDLDGFF